VSRRWCVAFAWACIAIALLAARPRATPGPFLRDFEAYWAAGSAFNSHADPYGRAVWGAERIVPGVVAQHDELLPFVGPPATLFLWALFARVPYAVGAALWSAVLAAFLLLLVAVAVRGAGRPISPTPFLAALALVIAFGPVTSDLALGQFALPAFTGAALVVLLEARTLPAKAAAAYVAFAQPNAALGLISQLGRNRTTVAIAIGALAAYFTGAIADGLAWPLTYARMLAAHAAAERFSAIQLTPGSIAFGFGASPAAAQTIALLIATIAVIAAIALALRAGDGFARFAAFSALTPFVAGFFHEHDLVVAYPAALWCALRTRGSSRVLGLFGTLLAGVDWLGLAQRPTGIAQSALLAVAAFTAFAALGETIETRGALPALAGFAALFAAAAVLAAGHPAPIWPDALRAFRASTNLPTAAIWSQELRASGLLAVQPVWALLRSLSLAGCALLACAIYRRSSYCRTASAHWDESS